MDRQQERQGRGTESSLDDHLREELGRRPANRRSRLTIALAALVLIAVGLVGGVAIGRSTADTSQQALPGFGNGGGFPGGGGVPSGASGFPGAGNVTFGTIESVDGNTITVQTADGEAVTVQVSGDTDIQVTQEGSIDDLETGDTVVVAGERSDDTIDATSVSEGGGAGFPQGAGTR